MRARTGARRSRRRRLQDDLAVQAPSAPLPASARPMLATLAEEPFDHPEWVFEPKLDGLRILGRFDGNELTLLSRNNQSQNFQFPEIEKALSQALQVPALVDGEIVCLDAEGRSRFSLLQQRFHLLDASEVAVRARRHPAVLYLFDILHWDSHDLTGLSLARRKEVLRRAIRWSDRVRWTEFQAAEGTALLRQACERGEEGIIGKRLDSRYEAGRSGAWVKIKCIGRQEFVIGGFTDPQRSRVGLGALLVGYYSDDGRRLIYAGKVGTGYTHEDLLDLRHRLEPLEQPHSPFWDGNRPRGGLHWVRPVLVAEIAFGEWTQNGLLRQPRYQGLRPDKSPRECRREKPRPTTPAARATSRRRRRDNPGVQHES